jgi:hypothetical protein
MAGRSKLAVVPAGPRMSRRRARIQLATHVAPEVTRLTA